MTSDAPAPPPVPRRLHAAAAKALKEAARIEGDFRTHDDAAAAPGDVLLFPGTAGLGVFWAVTEHDPRSDRYRLVAADAGLLAGGGDVALPHSPSGMTVRCAWTVEVAAADLPESELAGRLETEALDQVRRKCRSIAAGRPVGTSSKGKSRSAGSTTRT